MNANHFALACCAALLAGCADSAMPRSGEVPVSRTTAQIQTLPYHDVLYVSDILDSRIDIYPLNTSDPPPIGDIVLDVDTPTGIALDSAHDLYVSNNTTRTIGDIKKGNPNIMPV